MMFELNLSALGIVWQGFMVFLDAIVNFFFVSVPALFQSFVSAIGVAIAGILSIGFGTLFALLLLLTSRAYKDKYISNRGKFR